MRLCEHTPSSTPTMERVDPGFFVTLVLVFHHISLLVNFEIWFLNVGVNVTCLVFREKVGEIDKLPVLYFLKLGFRNRWGAERIPERCPGVIRKIVTCGSLLCCWVGGVRWDMRSSGLVRVLSAAVLCKLLG